MSGLAVARTFPRNVITLGGRREDGQRRRGQAISELSERRPQADSTRYVREMVLESVSMYGLKPCDT
jgi:hypothetical protein